MIALILSTQLLPVQSRRGSGDGRRLGEGSQRIDVEIPIVWMLLAEVVAGLRLGLTPGENLLQLTDELLQILTGKFPAEPKHQSCYVAHGGESLGNLAGSLKGDLQRESPPPFLFAVKSDHGSSALTPECGKPSCLTNRPWLTAPAGGRKFLTVRIPGEG